MRQWDVQARGSMKWQCSWCTGHCTCNVQVFVYLQSFRSRVVAKDIFISFLCKVFPFFTCSILFCLPAISFQASSALSSSSLLLLHSLLLISSLISLSMSDQLSITSSASILSFVFVYNDTRLACNLQPQKCPLRRACGNAGSFPLVFMSVDEVDIVLPARVMNSTKVSASFFACHSVCDSRPHEPALFVTAYVTAVRMNSRYLSQRM